MAVRSWLRRAQRDWERYLFLLLIAGSAALTLWVMLSIDIFHEEALLEAWGNIVGGLVAGVVVTIALTYLFKRQEQKEALATNREAYVQMKKLLLEYSKDLLEKLKVPIEPAPALRSFKEKEADIKEKTEALVVGLSGDPARLRQYLEGLSYVEYREFAHRLETFGHLRDQFEEKSEPGIKHVLAELDAATARVADHFERETSKWVAGTEFADGRAKAVIVGNKSEEAHIRELAHEQAPDVERAFQLISGLKERIEDVLLA